MSSRSHQIIRLTIESSSPEFSGRGSASTLTATVNFVDLAGSERASQLLPGGTRLKEGCHINRSLLTLGTVIRKLSKSRSGHIPYRDSKLTRILQNSLGGNAKTAIICTMNPARIHVEQSRNTLLFAGCAKEVTTNARVNVIMSDKFLVKYLKRELSRLESELRSPRLSFSPSDYSAIVREKDRRIEKLEEEINELILQQDIARSQVKDLLRMLGDDTNSTPLVAFRNYPYLRVQKSPEIKLRASILPDPHSLDVDTQTCSDGHSRSTSSGHIVKVPYFEDNFANSSASPRILTSTSSEMYSYHSWEDIKKRSNGTSEDLCREVRCIETRESGENIAAELNSLFCPEENTGFLKVLVNEDGRNLESPLSLILDKDKVFQPTPSPNGNETTDTSNGFQENESLHEKEKEYSSTALFPVAPSPENPSFLTPEPAKDSSSVSQTLRLTKSRSCKASITDSISPWLKTIAFSGNSSFFESERESTTFDEKLSPLSFDSNTLSGKDSRSLQRNAVDSEVEHNASKEIVEKIDEARKKNVKDVGLDPIEDEPKDPSTWPTEFKRLQREIIELWQDCHVSLVHRTYFFMLFQGEPSDAIYMEVEMRRMKFLRQKFSRADKTTVNGKCLTLASSEKALREERRKLSHRMLRKLTEQERASLFLKWGIGLSTKFRRLQLAHRLWTKTDDMDHVSDSADLVAKLITSLQPGETHNKEMFGLNFTPRS